MRGPLHMTIEEENLALAYLPHRQAQAFFSRVSKADKGLFQDQLAPAGHGPGGPDGLERGALSGGQRQALTLLTCPPWCQAAAAG